MWENSSIKHDSIWPVTWFIYYYNVTIYIMFLLIVSFNHNNSTRWGKHDLIHVCLLPLPYDHLQYLIQCYRNKTYTGAWKINILNVGPKDKENILGAVECTENQNLFLSNQLRFCAMLVSSILTFQTYFNVWSHILSVWSRNFYNWKIL